ncbi:MAG: hypothetical protein ACU0CI_01445 [Shimia sp.]
MEVLLVLVIALAVVGGVSYVMQRRAGRAPKRHSGSGDSGFSFTFSDERRRNGEDGSGGDGGDGGSGGGD